MFNKKDKRNLLIVLLGGLTFIAIFFSFNGKKSSEATTKENTANSEKNIEPKNDDDIVRPVYENTNKATQSKNANQSNSNKSNPVVKEQAYTTVVFNKIEHHFGTIAPMTSHNVFFEFTNTGDVPLILNSCGSTCGCTVAECPREPIMPGEKSKISVNFKPKENQLGNQRKLVFLKGNFNSGKQTLTLKAQVKKDEPLKFN